MGYGGRDGGSEWMGVPPSRFKPKKGGNAVKGGFKLPKSRGANSAASRFGVEEGERPIRPYRIDPSKRPKPRPLGPSKKGSGDNMKKLMPLRPQKRRRVGMGIMGGKGVLRKGR